jgi:hypothetical protein
MRETITPGKRLRQMFSGEIFTPNGSIASLAGAIERISHPYWELRAASDSADVPFDFEDGQRPR